MGIYPAEVVNIHFFSSPLPCWPYRHSQQGCVAVLAVLPRQPCLDLQRCRLAWSTFLVFAIKVEGGLEAIVLAHLVHETALPCRWWGRGVEKVSGWGQGRGLSCESKGNRWEIGM